MKVITFFRILIWNRKDEAKNVIIMTKIQLCIPQNVSCHQDLDLCFALMEWIGKRVKSRSWQRLQVVNKRKKMEIEAPVTSPPKRRKQIRRLDPDSDIEDITPTYNNRVPPVQENDRHSAGLRAGSVQNNSVKESFSRIIRDLNVGKSGPSSSKFRDGSELNTCVKESSFRVNDLDVVNTSVPSSFEFRDVSEQNTCVKEKCSPETRDLDVEKSGPSSPKLRDVSEQNTCEKEKCSPKSTDLDVEKSGPSSSKLRGVSEQNTCVKEKCSPEIRDLDVEKSGPSSSKLRDVSEQNTSVNEKCSPEIRDLDVGIPVPSSSKLIEVSEQNMCVMEMCSPDTRGLVVQKSLPGEIEILSDSESETEARAPAKKKLFVDSSRIVESISDGGDSTSESEGEEEENQESEENNTKDDISVESLSSEDPSFSSSSSSPSSSSSSSSDDAYNLKEVVEDNTDDDDFLKVSSPVRNVSIAERKPLVRYKRSGSCLTKPRKEYKKIRKLNRQEDEEERLKVVEIVTKPPSNPVFTCAHCGKENTGVLETHSSFIQPHALRDEIEDVNNFASTNASKYEDSVSINSGKSLEEPSRPKLENPKTGKEVKTLVNLSTSRPEIFTSGKSKEVEAPEKPSTYRPDILSSGKTKEVQALEKPSRPEIKNSEKRKEVQGNNKLGSVIPAVAVAGGLSKSLLANEPLDGQSDSSISSADKSGYESDPSLKDKEIKTNNNSDWRVLNGNHKEVDLFRLLVNSVWEKGQLGDEEAEQLFSLPGDQYQEHSMEDQRRYDDDGLLIIRPPPLIERFGMEEPQSPPEISESDLEVQKLWEELAFYNKSIDVSNEVEIEISTDETPAAQCRKGNHDLCLDLEIGLKCVNCGFVQREIRSMDESEWGEKITRERRKSDRYDEEEFSNLIGKLGIEAPNMNSLDGGCVSSEGTVWDKIPGVKSQMYPHQQEGFEFIWTNLAGTIFLNKLKDFENSDETGGCIMSHAPGTGKTRLTIIFLQAYLACFPDCKPVIIAPASLLLTWAEEFKKWNISIPFHNLSSLEFTGKENAAALGLLMQKNATARSNNEIRMVKIYSWIKAKSILGISYNLYEKLAGVKDEDKKTKTVREVKPDKESEDIREILMGRPGLLVLDEAHTPRNQRSCIWKTLSKVETQKRILLSGTPFQNNFQELCNVLGLARPKYLEKLTATLKKSGMTVTKRGKKALGNEINNRGIEELKTVMLPFVHVHKGSILQRSLPGLRECVVVLNPPELQKRVLESIEVTHNRKKINVFETEHKLSLVSVHPSLVSRCKLSAKESLTIDEALLAQLKKVRLDPKQSVKTRFLMEFVELCEVIKEKVLVFSQYIDPLKLIMKHLVSRFKWNPGEEVLYMHGKLEQKQRQTLINEFNDPKSKAKVFLASTKACSEGISLVGASRVILLDVVWNPAVERQAISRAYRIGQQRIVYTYHLVAKGTPEGPKYCKQAQKDRISELVFACSSRPDKGKEKIAEAVTEDKVLDTMVQRSKLGDMFDNLIIQPKEADLVEGFSILMP
ncbi:hypothetical protein CARUB_v10008086mg [Capsella rubella]|uniref:SNF2 domain-containing protein CLASSY 3 n=1 Tax=Capsella rubella TaxID=81985 RepID=R0IGW0_9BRAS|nr:hypothetical protein CARUB_v10008086mg [Capsella rubella]